MEVPYSAIEDAAGRLDGYVHRTPALSSMTAAAWLHHATGVRIADGLLYLKAEHLQKTGSFKARGMTNRIATLPEDARARGAIIAVGRQRRAGVRVGGRGGSGAGDRRDAGGSRPLQGRGVPRVRARVVLHGTHVGDTFAEMERIRDAEGLMFVHPFDDPMVIAGNGTVGLELVDDVPDVDVVVVGIGGGGLISGVATAVKARRPSARIVGVEPERSNAVSLAIERNEVVTIQPQSVADGLGAPRRPLDARDHPSIARWHRAARRPDDPCRHAFRGRAPEAGGRARGRGGARGGVGRARADRRTASVSRSSCPAAM